MNEMTDKNLLQDVEGIRSDDRYTETSEGYDEDCSGSKHNKSQRWKI